MVVDMVKANVLKISDDVDGLLSEEEGEDGRGGVGSYT